MLVQAELMSILNFCQVFTVGAVVLVLVVRVLALAVTVCQFAEADVSRK